MSEEKNTKETSWTLKLPVQLTHIFASISLAIGGISYVRDMETRLTVAEARIAAQAETDLRQDRDSRESIALLRAQLEKIDSKLDRVLLNIRGTR